MMTKRNALFVVVTLAILAVLVYTVTAAPGVQVGFEIDGNTVFDGTDPDATDDWETVVLGGEPDWDAGAGYLIRDGSSGPKAVIAEQNVFVKGGKFAVPEDWIIAPGNTPAQNDLTNVYVYPLLPNGGGTDTWMILGMERIKKQGTFDLDFEYNQVPWDGTSGTLVRTTGDVSIGFELSGNPSDPQADLTVLVLVYDPGDATCAGWDSVYGEGWCVVFSGAGSALGNAGEATMNAVAFPQPPWGSYQSSGAPLPAGADVEQFFFAEAALNLTELGIAPGCPGFGSVHAKSRSSLEITADMKDLAGPLALPISCRIYGNKYKDANGDGVVPNDADSPLENWTIELLDGNCTAGVDCRTDTTDSNGYYEFGGLSNGTYSVQEVCSAGWEQTYPDPTNGCGSGIHTGIVIDVANTDQGPYDFGNAQGSIIIRKEDAYGTLLPGAGFTFDVWPFGQGDPEEILDGSAYDQATGNDGIVCLDGVALGTYEITESTVPEGYVGDEPQSVTVDSSSTCAERLSGEYTADATFTNLLGSIIIRKEDADGTLLPGAGFTFDVWPFVSGAPEEIFDGGSYDQANGNDGVVCIDDVLLGDYVITESTVPGGYEGDDPQTVTVDSASTCADRLGGAYTADATFTNLLGSIIIRKEDAYGTLLPGAGFSFDVWPFVSGAPEEIFDGGSYDQANGNDGVVCIDDVLLGDYVITESTVPGGYEGDDPQTVTVDSASTCADRLAGAYTADATFTNLLGSIIIRKEAKDQSAAGGTSLVGGAGFTFDPNPFTGGAEVEIFDGGAEDQAADSGILCIDDVLLTSYQVSETDVPANYDGDPDTEPVVVSSASTCAVRLGGAYTPDATFENVPLSEIEVIFQSLAGDSTAASIVCKKGTTVLDAVVENGAADPAYDDSDEVFTGLVPGTYDCQIIIDP